MAHRQDAAVMLMVNVCVRHTHAHQGPILGPAPRSTVTGVPIAGHCRMNTTERKIPHSVRPHFAEIDLALQWIYQRSHHLVGSGAFPVDVKRLWREVADR